ncbi:retrovirus-related Pol polyprotein from transposon 412 [Trichonephila clavipes]|nr:retrovirus-related Pol polyprotein from transposon 412 [Trichonephila clavipes]
MQKLTTLAFSDFLANVREMICLEYFVDGLKDEEIQMAVRMADFKDLKSALLYALKVETAIQASCIDRHSLREARVTADEPCESRCIKGIDKLKEEMQALIAERQNRKRCSITSCGCGESGHLRSPLPRSSDGNNNILVVKDYFTKWPKAYPIPDQEASTVAEVLVQHWISRFGSLYNCTPREKLRYCSLQETVNQLDWDKKLPFFLLAYRSAVHETTGYSPYQILFGRDLLFSWPPDAPLVSEEYIEKLQARMEEMHHLARERIDMASEKKNTRYDARATGHDFHEGDKVWLWNPKRRKGLSPKLQTNWESPYTVLKRLNDVVVRIQKHPTQNRR